MANNEACGERKLDGATSQTAPTHANGDYLPTFALYYSDYRGKSATGRRNLGLFAQSLSKYGKFEAIFRYRLPFLQEEKYRKISKFFLYENLPQLTDSEVSSLERRYTLPYNLMRIMTTISRWRYPKLGNLPDDLILAKIAAAWVKFFTQKKPDIFVVGLMDDYAGIVGVEVARRMGIKTCVVFAGGLYSGRYLLCDNNLLPVFYKKLTPAQMEEGRRKTREAISQVKVLNAAVAAVQHRWFDVSKLSNIPPIIAAALSNFKGYYFDIPKIERKMWPSTFDLIRRQGMFFIRSRLSWIYFNESPAKGEKFVFFPLHFTEDTAIVTAVPFADQAFLAEEISKVLPHGVKLYIKPHPHWKCADMRFSEMARLRKIPNARLLKYAVGAKDLVRQAEYTVVINSSVAYECLALHKPVYALGNCFSPDIVPFMNNPRELLQIAGKHKFDWKRMDDFMAKIYAHGIKCDETLFASGGLDEDTATRLAAGIEGFRKHKAK